MEGKIHRNKFLTSRVSNLEKETISRYYREVKEKDLSTYIREMLWNEIPEDFKKSVSQCP